MKKIQFFILLALTIIGCTDNSVISEENLSQSLSNLEKDKIHLSEITSFDWQHFMLIPPYTYLEDLENKIDIDLSSIENIGIESRDDINLLCFFQSNKLIKCFIQPRFPYDFTQKNGMELLKRESALLSIKQSSNGYKVTVFSE